MNLYILRHGSAGTRRKNPITDARRPLDKQGKRDCLLLGNLLSTMNIGFDLIVSSPLKRSLQTASFVGNEAGYDQPILSSEALAPSGTFEQFTQLLNECAAYDSVLAVGHSPNLVDYLGLLLHGNGTQDCPRKPASIRLRKGAIARVTVERGAGMLQWHLDPRLVRTLFAGPRKARRRRTLGK